MGKFIDRFSATPQMRAHGIPKWGYGPITGCAYLAYSGLNFAASAFVLFSHAFAHKLVESWIDFSEPLVKLVGRFVPAVDSFEAKLLLLSRSSSVINRETDILVLRNFVAMNSLLFAIFAVAITLIAPFEAKHAVRH